VGNRLALAIDHPFAVECGEKYAVERKEIIALPECDRGSALIEDRSHRFSSGGRRGSIAQESLEL
jgi:hypothetical protein